MTLHETIEPTGAPIAAPFAAPKENRWGDVRTEIDPRDADRAILELCQGLAADDLYSQGAHAAKMFLIGFFGVAVISATTLLLAAPNYC